MAFVWDETIQQTGQMLESWTGPAIQHIPSFAKDTRTLSLNVLAATGFRRSYKFRSANEPATDADQAGSYRDALQTVLDNIIMLMILSPKLLSLSFAPESWHRIARAAADFKEFMIRMLDEETIALKEGKSGSGGLMTSFVRALDVKQKEDAKGSANSTTLKGLTADEIFGNIFVINFAGHDTTANTLAFSMLLLAAHPDVQDWVAEELQELTPANEKWEYSFLFPKLKRCKAILVKLFYAYSNSCSFRQLETLRLYPPIMSLPKWTNGVPQRLKVGGQIIVIPPNTGVMPSLLSVQTHPRYWKDPLVWKPSRWISGPPAPTSEITARFQREVVYTPAKCTYFPWSDGPQNCPGAKFSQVEFVAVLACLLRDHRVNAIQNPGESFEQTRKRILATAEDVDMEMLLRMKDADRVPLVCKRVS